MNRINKLTLGILSCALATLTIGAANASESTYCIAVGGGFGSGGTTFVGLGFTVPSDGNCVPWSGFTKTASSVILLTHGVGCLSSNGKVLSVSVSSADPSYFGAGTQGSDYIQLCPAGVSSCPLGSGSDQGAFSGTAKTETCTSSLLNLPTSHD